MSSKKMKQKIIIENKILWVESTHVKWYRSPSDQYSTFSRNPLVIVRACVVIVTIVWCFIFSLMDVHIRWKFIDLVFLHDVYYICVASSEPPVDLIVKIFMKNISLISSLPFGVVRSCCRLFLLLFTLLLSSVVHNQRWSNLSYIQLYILFNNCYHNQRWSNLLYM